jgi:uncharacterized membrane protein YfcA
MPTLELSPVVLASLFGGGLLAGFVDSIAGGGGLISLPVLLSVGLPPQLALGTNKLQGSFGTFSSAFNYIRKGKADLNRSYAGILFTLIGAMLGAWVIQQLEADFLKPLIPILLAMVFLYTLFSPRLGYTPRQSLMPEQLFFILFGVSLGFYDGFFGPGAGSFWTAALLVFLGYDLTRAAGSTRIMNFTSNLVALTMFVIGGNVLYGAGLCMGAGQVIGARVGSNMAIRRGARFIRPVFLVVVFLTIVRLVYLYSFAAV